MAMHGPGPGLRRHRRVATAALVSGALAALLAGCTNGASQGASSIAGLSPHKAVLASVQTTESASSASIGLSVSISGTPSISGAAASGKPISIAITGHGVFSFTDRVGQISLTVPSLGHGAGGTLEVRLIGNDLYLSTPRLSAVDGGKPWIHVSASDFQKDPSQSGPIGALADGDPTQILTLLKQLGASVTEVGQAQVGGVPTTEYQGTIDLTGGAGGGAGSTALGHQLAQSLGLQSVPFDVWIDHAGRARQLRTSFKVIGLTVTAEEQLGSFGSAVSVTPPPADQTADGSTLLHSGQLGNLFS